MKIQHKEPLGAHLRIALAYNYKTTPTRTQLTRFITDAGAGAGASFPSGAVYNLNIRTGERYDAFTEVGDIRLRCRRGNMFWYRLR